MKANRVDLEGFQEVSLWLPFIDFAGDIEKRWQHMNGVLDNILASYKRPKILDIAAGGGHDTIRLLKHGYDVTANETDIDGGFSKYLREKIKAVGVSPKVLSIDWRDFLTDPRLKDEEYDVLFSLGNSFPNYLLKESEWQQSLKGFWRVLKPGGTLLFDTRNYDYMIDNAEAILKDPERNYHFSYQTTYLNRDMAAFPTEITPRKIRLLSKHYVKKQATYIDLYPVTIKSVKNLVKTTLGASANLKIYYDYQAAKPEHYDFAQYVLTKAPN